MRKNFMLRALGALAFSALLAFGATTLQNGAKRIVVLDPASVETIYMLGAQSQIAAISTLQFSKIWPEDETAKLKSVGTYSKPNLEQIVELKPDLVITSFHSMGVNEDLKKFKLNTLTLKADSVAQIYENIAKIGEITGQSEKAKEVAGEIEAKFKALESSNLKGKKVLALFTTTPLTAFNAKTLPGDIFARLGMVNIAGNLEHAQQSPIVSAEFVLTNNPDVIVLIGMAMGDPKDTLLKEHPTLAKTNAAKNNKIISVPSSLLLRGTPRISEGIEKFYEMVK